MMPHSNRLFLYLGLLVFTLAGSSAQNETQQIAPSPTLPSASAVDNLVTPSAGSAMDTSALAASDSPADKSTPSITESVAESSLAILGTTFVVTSSVAQPETLPTAVLSPSETSVLASTAAVDGAELSSSEQIMSASAAILSSSELPLGTESILVSSSEEFSPSQTSVPEVTAVQNSSLFVQSTSVALESSQANLTELISSSTATYLLLNSTLAEVLNGSSVQPTPSPSDSVDSAMLSASSSLSSIATSGSAEVPITPSSTVVAPPPSSSIPGGATGGRTPPSQNNENKGPEQEEKEGGGGGMSSGSKAAIGIFVTLALIGLIALGIVLYRRNYFTPRSIKALMKGGVRYQTHDESMSYNDEYQLIDATR